MFADITFATLSVHLICRELGFFSKKQLENENEKQY